MSITFKNASTNDFSQILNTLKSAAEWLKSKDINKYCFKSFKLPFNIYNAGDKLKSVLMSLHKKITIDTTKNQWT